MNVNKDFVLAEDVEKGMVLKTWMGSLLVVDIKEYIGNLDFVLNIIEFSNGSQMSNTVNCRYQKLFD